MKVISKIWLLGILIFLAESVSAAGEIAVVAHPSVAGGAVSQARLVNLFLIPGASWPDGQVALPIDLKLPSSIKADFYKLVSGRSQNQLRTYWARQVFTGAGTPPVELNSAFEVIRKVSTTPGAIGYVPRDAIEGAPVKVLAILPEQIK